MSNTIRLPKSIEAKLHHITEQEQKSKTEIIKEE